mgnify:FL=1
MRLIFVRHGDPDYENDSITDVGKIEAELVAKRLLDLDIKEFYSSPLGRARHTAEYTVSKMGREALVMPWLEEFLHEITLPDGRKMGQIWDFMPRFFAADKRFLSLDTYFDIPYIKEAGIKEYYDKVVSGFDSLMKEHGYVWADGYYKAERPNKDTLVFFCHFGVTCVIMSHLLRVPPTLLAQNFFAAPTSLTTLISEEREEGAASFRCVCFGDTSHLYAANREPSFAGRFCEVYTDFDVRH